MEIIALDATAAAAAVALWQACGLTRPWTDPHSDFQRAVDGDSSVVLGAYNGHELIGTAMVGVDGHRGWVYYVASAPDRRGQGVGRALMAAAEDWVRARGMPSSMVRRSNTTVVDFYAALGYGRDCIVLGRRFDGSSRRKHTDARVPCAPTARLTRVSRVKHGLLAAYDAHTQAAGWPTWSTSIRTVPWCSPSLCCARFRDLPEPRRPDPVDVENLIAQAIRILRRPAGDRVEWKTRPRRPATSGTHCPGLPAPGARP